MAYEFTIYVVCDGDYCGGFVRGPVHVRKVTPYYLKAARQKARREGWRFVREPNGTGGYDSKAYCPKCAEVRAPSRVRKRQAVSRQPSLHCAEMPGE